MSENRLRRSQNLFCESYFSVTSPILDKHSWVKTGFEPSWQQQQWWKLHAADKTRHNKLVLFYCTNDVLIKIEDEEAASLTGLFSDTDIVDAPGRVEPADTARDQTGTVCSVEINILLDQRRELSTHIYTYLDISTQYLRGSGQQWHGPGLETLFDIQRRHGAACSQGGAGGTQDILIRGSLPTWDEVTRIC